MWPFWFGGWWFPLHGLFSILLLVVLVLMLSSVFRGVRSPVRYGRSAALDMLEQRYARGEIQRDEYLQKKSDLGG